MTNSYPLISTKIRTPRRRQALLRRGRLTDFLHSNIHHKLILVSAGAGYGKTSLLIDYAHDTDLPVCWYSLDANDAHLPTFIEYLVASIRQCFPQFGEATLELLHRYSGPVEIVEPFVRVFINEMEQVIASYFVIVLDDYHEVLESEPVNAFLDGLLRYLPEQCHIILASRRVPRRLTLTRLAARQEVVGLGVEHLSFTASEISELLELLGWRDFTPEQVQVLAERSEGWITGILLAAQTNWPGSSRDILKLTGAAGGVFEYLAEEVLAQQSEEMQQFLLGSALFHEMTPPLCDALLGIDCSAQLLRELADQNLFTFPLDAEGIWYQYHQLFREFLLARLEADTPDRFRRLSLKKAELLAHQGQWDRAIEGYLQAQAYEKAVEAIEIIAQGAFDAGNRQALQTWIDAVPEMYLDQHPRLWVFRARVSTERSELDRAATWLDRAYQLFMARNDSLGAARALVQRAVVQRFRGQLRDAIETCRSALKIIGAQDLLTATLAHHNIGICYNLQGQLGEGLTEMQAALQLAQRNLDDTNAAFIAHDMGTGEVARGHLSSARRYYHQALVYWRKLGNPSALASTLQSLGVVHHYLGQYTEAANRLQEGLAKARDAADARIEAYALASQGDLYRDTGRYDAGVEAYRAALDIAAKAPFTQLTIYVLGAMGDALHFRGEINRAQQVLTEALDQAQGREMSYEIGLCQLSLGMLALGQGQLGDAQVRLDQARELFARADARRDLARTCLYRALLAYFQDDETSLHTNLADMARLADELGSTQFIVAEVGGNPIFRRVEGFQRYAEEHHLGKFDDARLRAEISRRAFGRKHTRPTPSISPTSKHPELSLELLALNGSQVIKNDQVISEWESLAARTLLFLLAAYPQGLRRDQAIEMLWPEVGLARGSSMLHSTIYRLRTALSKDVIVYTNSIYQLNPTLPCRYDVAEFQQAAAQGRGDGEAAHLARGRAFDLYRTAYLEGCDFEWCEEIRRSLQTELMALLLIEGRYLAQRKQAQKAEACYGRALSLDAYDERAHRGMMWCRATLNDKAGATRQFNECARLLEEELDLKPSGETLTLYHAILSDQPLPIPS